VVETLPLTVHDVRAYLHPLFGVDLDPQEPVMQAAAQPLLLELMSRHPDLKLLRDRQQYPTWREVYDAVLAQAVPELLGSKRRHHPYANHRDWTPGDAERWLGFVATHLGNLGTFDFAWWHLQAAISGSWPPRGSTPAEGTYVPPCRLDLTVQGRAGRLLPALRWSFVGVMIGIVTIAVPELISFAAPWLLDRNEREVLDHTMILLVATAVAAIGVGAARGVIGWSMVPQEDPVPGTPADSLREDLRMSRKQRVIFGAGLGLAGGSAFVLINSTQNEEPMIFLAGIIGAGIPIFAIAYLYAAFQSLRGGGTASGIYFAAVRYLAVRRRVPWRLMRFLEDAYRVGLLRKQGGVYQFRLPWLRTALPTPGASQGLHR
jgi:hypothetical protein